MPVNLLSQGLHGMELDVFSAFPDPVWFVRDQNSQKQFEQDEQMLRRERERASAQDRTGVQEAPRSPVLTSTSTASRTTFVLLIPPPSSNSRNRGDNSSSQQLDMTETKLRTSKATWGGENTAAP